METIEQSVFKFPAVTLLCKDQALNPEKKLKIEKWLRCGMQPISGQSTWRRPY